MNLSHNKRLIEILLVDDDRGGAGLTRMALEEAQVRNNLHVVEDGVEAMAFLRHEGKYAGVPQPDAILLDLNLPLMDGHEVLAEIKSDPALKHIPVMVLTNSHSQRDILHAYQLHANCYMTKPLEFSHFVIMMRKFHDFWLDLVMLPLARRS